jgi:hypothetical protein
METWLVAFWQLVLWQWLGAAFGTEHHMSPHNCITVSFIAAI